MNGFDGDRNAEPGLGARGQGRGWFAVVSLGVVVVLVGAGVFWMPSHSDTKTAADSRSLAAFRERVPALRAVLEPPPTDDTADTSSPVTVPKTVPLHRRISGNRPLRALVVGDSVGVTLARGMTLWARAHGNAKVLDASRNWCPLGRELPMSHGIGIQLPGSGCDDWGTRWADLVEKFDPDVVFVNYSVWEIAPRQLPGSTDLVQPGSPQLDAWQLSEYQVAADVLSKRGAGVVWFTIPCDEEPTLKGSPLWYVNRRTVPALAASRRAVHVVDLDHELCARGPSHDYAGVREARPDGAHFSDAGAFAVAEWVMPIVLGDAPNPKTVDER